MEGSSEREQHRQQVIEVLNTARGLELNAIAQYMNHHYNLENMDYGDLAAKLKLIAIDEMKHAELFADRIEELGGQPTTEPGGKPERDGDAGKMFTADAHLETGALNRYNDFVLICRDNGDNASAKLFEKVIDEEQIHFNYFENIRKHIEKLGDTYLAQVAGTPSATGIVYQGFASRQGSDVPGGGGGQDGGA